MICEGQCGIRVIGYRLKLSCVDLNILVRIKFGNGTIKKKQNSLDISFYLIYSFIYNFLTLPAFLNILSF